jgi:TusA-related sulfurtransferase
VTRLKQRTDYLIDARSAIEPITLLKMRQTFREMKGGESMEVLVGDPDTRQDIFRLLPDSLYELIEIKEDISFCRIFLKKRA